MKNLNQYITEKFKINSKTISKYTCQPKTRKELKSIIEDRLEKNKNANLNDIDVSNIDDMHNLFVNLDIHNIDISEWDVSNVKVMHRMFYCCENFNSDLSNWDVSNVINMTSMFEGCKKFNCDLSSWNVSNVKIMDDMFYGCNSLKNKPSWYKK